MRIPPVQLALLFLVAACGGGGSAPATPATRSINLTTVPTGAVCEVRRDGDLLTRVTAPGVVEVPRSRRALELACAGDGFLTTPLAVPAEEDQAMAAMMLLASGIIGVATQSAMGNLHSYPKTVEVVLVPARFADAAARDAHFAARTQAIRELYDPKIARIRNGCTPGDTAGCNALLAEPTEARDAALRALERLRGEASIGA